MKNPNSPVERLEPRQLMSVSVESDGTLRIAGSDAADTLEFGRQGTELNVRLNADSYWIDLAAIRALAIDLKGGADELTLDRTKVDLNTTVSLGTGVDVVTVAGGPGTGQLAIAGDGDADHVRVTLQGVVEKIRLSENAIVREGAFTLDPALTFDGFEQVTLEGGTQQDVFVVEGVLAGVKVNINGNAGDDSVAFGDDQGAELADIQGNVHVDLGDGDDEIKIADDANTQDTTYRFRNGALQRQGWRDISFTKVDNLAIDAGTGNDDFWIDQIPEFTHLVFNGNLPERSMDGLERDFIWVNAIDDWGVDYFPVNSEAGAIYFGTDRKLEYAGNEEIDFLRRDVGNVYDDRNGNGKRDVGEPGVAGVRIEQRLNGEVEVMGTTDGNGQFVMERFFAWQGFVVLPAGWQQVTPTPGSGPNFAFGQQPFQFAQETSDGQIHQYGDAIGITSRPSTASIAGRVFSDNDRNGLFTTGDTAFAQVRVWIDSDEDRIYDAGEQFATTDGSGNYRFENLTPGEYRVTIDAAPEYVYDIVTLAIGYDQTETRNYPLRQDLPTNSMFGWVSQLPFFPGSGGYGLNPTSGITVYIDLDKDGQRDSSEPVSVTSAGRYLFKNVSPGTYVIRMALAPGFQDIKSDGAHTVVKTSSPFYGMDLAFVDTSGPGSVHLSAFLDYDGDGVFDAGVDRSDPTVINTAWIDVNDNGLFDDGTGPWTLPAGQYKLRNRSAVGHRATGPVDGDFRWITVEGATSKGYSIGQQPLASLGSIRGTLFIDHNANGVRDSNDEVSEGSVYIDLNNNGVFDQLTEQRVYTTNGAYEFLNLSAGGYFVRRIKLSTERDLTVTGPATANAYLVQLAQGQNVTGRDFGLYYASREIDPTLGSIVGNVFFDANKNGKLDTGEAGVAGRVVWLDKDNDSAIDTNEPQTVTDPSGAYRFSNLIQGTYKVRQQLPVGFTQTTPLNNYGVNVSVFNGYVSTAAAHGTYSATGVGGAGSISGRLWFDVNADGVWQSSEGVQSGKIVYVDANSNGRRDSGEKQATTDSAGAYSFGGLAAGTYRVRREVPSGYYIISAPLDLVLAAGQVIVDANIGTAQGTPPVNPNPPTNPTPPTGTTGKISGYLWNDTNGNGVQDGTETKAGGKVVFVDANNNGKLDTGEKQTTTNSQGIYTFSDLVAGTYRVRRVMPTGYRVTTAPRDITLAAGENRTDANIGSTDRVLITGSVFGDVDNDKIFDTNEAGLTAWRVYLDHYTGGKWVSGVKSVLTGADGSYSFTDAAAGQYRVRVETKAGFALTSTNPVALTLATGATGKALFANAQLRRQ